MAGIESLQSEILWARRPFGKDVGWGKYAEPRWHRFVMRAETEIVVACGRRLPLSSPVFPEVPEGGYACRNCTPATQRSAVPLSERDGLHRMTNEWKPTGVWDALLIELLLGLSMSPEAVMAMSAQERIETLQQAAADGRLSPDQAARLRVAGLIPADPDEA